MGSYILWAFIGSYVTIYVTECIQPSDSMLSICGYVQGASVQSQSAIYTFITLYWWVPAILSFILLFLSSLWNIEKKTKILSECRIKEDNNLSLTD